MLRDNRPFYLGLTGGIGSGKSTVSSAFKRFGAKVIDADAIAREVTSSNGAAIYAIKQAFGPLVIDSSTGALNRTHMRALAFTNEDIKLKLETILHPIIENEIWRQAISTKKSDFDLIVFDIPLLVESKKWSSRLDAIMVVDCNVQTQIERTVIRSNISTQQAQLIVNSQTSRVDRTKSADMVIFNDKITLEQLDNLVFKIGDYITSPIFSKSML